MKKQLNADIIANELRGNSAFFPSYKEERKADPVVEQTPLPTSLVTASSPQPVPPYGSYVPYPWYGTYPLASAS